MPPRSPAITLRPDLRGRGKHVLSGNIDSEFLRAAQNLLLLFPGGNAPGGLPMVNSLARVAEIGRNGRPSIKQAWLRRLHGRACQIMFDRVRENFDSTRQSFSYTGAMSELNRRLRALREAARPPLTATAMASELGFDSRQAYHHYESVRGFKGQQLPIDLALRIASVLGERGVDRSELMSLTGFAPAEVAPLNLTRGEEAWLVVWLALSPVQRRLAMEQLCCALGWDEPDGEPNITCALSRREQYV